MFTAESVLLFVIGEHLENRELRVRRDARESHRVAVFIENFVTVLILYRLIDAVVVKYRRTRYNTGDVRAVVRIGRIHVRVVVRIVVCERNFCIIIYVVYGYGLVFGNKTLARIAVENSAFYGSFVEHRDARFGGGHRLKRRVRIIETGIEYRNDHSAAVIALRAEFVGYFINTRSPDVRLVLNVYILRGVIIFGHGNFVDAAYLLYVGKIFDVDFNRDGVRHGIVRVFVFVRNVRG